MLNTIQHDINSFRPQIQLQSLGSIAMGDNAIQLAEHGDAGPSPTRRHERSHVVELWSEIRHLTWAAFTGQAHPYLRLPWVRLWQNPLVRHWRAHRSYPYRDLKGVA